MNLNCLPRDKYIYFLGIGGISMSSLAHILIERGYKVSGYDRTKSELTEMLEKLGASIFYDIDEAHIENVGAAVFSAAFGETHPEIINIRKRGISLYSRAELLGAIAKGYKNAIGVSGTHGKSSTTAMLYSVFAAEEGASPTVLNGAVMSELSSQYKIGSDETMVFECCEYKDSFLSFFPHIAVVLNVRLDHTDYYHSMEQLRNSFSCFMNNTGKDGYAVVNVDSPDAAEAAREYKGNLVTFSALGKPEADCRLIKSTVELGCASVFTVEYKGRLIERLSLSVPGNHSLCNSLAAVCCAEICGLSEDTLRRGLKAFKGIKRRFEYKGMFMGATVYDDYAHHPDEIKATLAAAKAIGAKRVVTVFQPHTYSRLHDLFDGFCSAFDDSDLTVFAETYSARESNVYGISPKSLCERVKNSVYIPTFGEIEDFLKSNLRQGDLLLIMGAGDIENLCEIVKKSSKKA